MGKSKDTKAATKAKSETPAAKSKAIAKDTAAKVSSKKSSKPVKKAATPSSESDDDSASEESSDSESEEEAPAKTNGKANGKANAASKQVKADSSDSSDSSDDEEDSDSGDEKKTDASADSDDSSDSESDEEATPVAAVAKKVVDAGKSVVNGAAKAVEKATASDSDSSDSSDEEAASGSGSSDSDDSDASEAEAPSKKRKASEDAEPATKKAKVETAPSDTGSKNLFIGNLSWNVDDEWLLQEFKEFGEITGARVISDKATGRSKGFGYVEFANAADAAKALEAKKGALIDGREANVDFSTPRDDNKPRERAQGRAQQYGDQTNPPSDTLFLGNLSFEADENIVGEAFGAYGTVVNVRLPTDQETGNPKGFGYITFQSVDDAKTAFESMVGADIAGRPVRLDYATPRPERSEGGGRGGGRGGRGGFDRGGRGGGGRGGRGGFGDRGGRGGRGGGRGGSTNRGGFGDFKGKKQTF